jgi:uncharacterized protein
LSAPREHVLLRVYLRTADRVPHVPTYQRLVQAARASKLAGATVLHGIAGYGHRDTAQGGMFSFFSHTPVIVEIVDSPQNIAAFLHNDCRKLITNGLVTLERAAVIMYRQRTDLATELRLADQIAPLSTIPEIQKDPSMKSIENGTLLRVFIGSSDRFQNQPLHEAILHEARKLGLAGATILRGTEGFGANSVIHKTSLVEMSTDLPIVIEIVDSQEKVNTLLPQLQTMVQEGMITMEHVAILMYGANAQK